MWHCHILSHEEMEMMRPISVVVKPKAPTGFAAAMSGGAVNLSWADNSLNETGFVIQRASNEAFTEDLTTLQAGENATSYVDSTAALGQTYYYRVFAKNVVGDVTDYTVNNPQAIGFPSSTAVSDYSNSAMIAVAADTPPAAPTNLTATAQAGPQVALAWTDNADNETGFVIERAVNGGAFAQLATPAANAVAYIDSAVLAGSTYAYRVRAVNSGGPSDWSNTATVAVPLPPLAAPSNLTGIALRVGNGPNTRVTLTWVDNSNNETGFTIQRATNPDFTGAVSTNVAANTTSYRTGNLPRNTTYWFRIRANNNVLGPSAWSNVFTITTP
jgi:hypothetical protein